MEKIDFKKELKQVYKASDKKIEVVEIPELKYLVVSGTGYPGDNPLFMEAIEILYGVAYTLKFMLKEESLQPKGYCDFVIPPLEATWCMGDEKFDANQPEKWQWDMMIMQPGWISEELIEKAKQEIRKKKMQPILDKLQMKAIKAHKAVKTLHIGPYDEVSKVYEKLEAYINENDLTCSGPSREIYLSDPRRTAPEKLKTVVMLPG
ncbi:MAG: GyrI-like domain-containing protein [Bacteroidales bacterium]|nr:GyrI-like domain-containing protein [Bacteroidales bacterium]MCF8454557.1 GyrI-like domain-containing protein [Bacteroidales bacterium]